jgi:AraC-like DNA-binding protein
MLYLERFPSPPLAGLVDKLWYSRAPEIGQGRERVLPDGCVHVVISLAREYLVDPTPDGPGGEDQPGGRRPPALVMGARSIYEVIDRSDMADLAGIGFTPGGFRAFAGDAVDRFTNVGIPLEDLWGNPVRALRDLLRELDSPCERLSAMESFLTARLTRARAAIRGEVGWALQKFGAAPGIRAVREVAAEIGWSERRLSQVFREEIGLSPKRWCRLQRFQRAVRELHRGADLGWAELALDLGYYDQSHFANEFRAFSGIDATTYSARRTRWKNHVAMP